MSIGLNNSVITNVILSNYNKADNRISKILEDLSSGIKINSADDDAVDTVISKNIKNFANTTNNALTNLQNINSALNITEGSMEGIGDIVSKIHSLALDASNGIQDTESVVAIINEIIERLQEIDRLAKNTKFQGKNLLDGSVESFPVQINGESDEDFTLDMKDIFKDCSTNALGIELPDVLNPESDDFEPTIDNFQSYLEKLSNALNQILSNRNTIGSYENRLESIYDLMQKKHTELQERNSLIMDTNIAQSASEYVSEQILEQLNISLFTTKNQAQSSILGLFT